jgi:DsbC/DsbD-like thiol-disulfide interchange protein/cytochrome c biogenesis protein CcdA
MILMPRTCRRLLLTLVHFGALIALCAPGFAAAAGSGSQSHQHIDVELIAEVAQAAPGARFQLALRLLPERGWHTYWRNPGDSGLETRIDWDLPSGVSAGPIHWPTPQRLPIGHLVNYGFEGETWLLTDLQMPADWPAGRALDIAARADWLVCEIECIPGSADLRLHLPVAAGGVRPAAAYAAGFAAARARLPEPVDWPARFASDGGPRSGSRRAVRLLAQAGAIHFLGLALLGGLLLNLMPCVFPVLSLKALSLAQGAGQARREQALHGISYTLGILASFGAGGGSAAVPARRRRRHRLGFPAAVAAVHRPAGHADVRPGAEPVRAIDFGTRLMGIGQQLTVRGGYRGSFFTGVLATLVASPCTAPLMGVALGIAVLQPPFTALVIFFALGLGMALPLLLLGLLPVLGRWLPRPGAWMETFKQAMAFPLYLTVVWLLWVLGRQAGLDAMATAAGPGRPGAGPVAVGTGAGSPSLVASWCGGGADRTGAGQPADAREMAVPDVPGPECTPPRATAPSDWRRCAPKGALCSST